MDKAVALARTKGINDAARFYVDAIRILEETRGEKDESREKIDEAFRNAQQISEKTIDELLEQIEGPSFRNTDNKHKKLSLKKKTHTQNKQAKT